MSTNTLFFSAKPTKNQYVQDVIQAFWDRSEYRIQHPICAELKAVIERALDESSVLEIGKVSGAYNVDVVIDSVTHTMHYVPQNMPTLLGMFGIFPRSFNGMDTDFFPAFEGAYRLHRNETGKVVSTSFTPHNA